MDRDGEVFWTSIVSNRIIGSFEADEINVEDYSKFLDKMLFESNTSYKQENLCKIKIYRS